MRSLIRQRLTQTEDGRQTPAQDHQPDDKLPSGTCLRCGGVGAHPDPGDCITYLRDRLADASEPLETSETVRESPPMPRRYMLMLRK